MIEIINYNTYEIATIPYGNKFYSRVMSLAYQSKHCDTKNEAIDKAKEQIHQANKTLALVINNINIISERIDVNKQRILILKEKLNKLTEDLVKDETSINYLKAKRKSMIDN